MDLAKEHELSCEVQLVYRWFRDFYPDVYYNMNQKRRKVKEIKKKKRNNHQQIQITELVKALEESEAENKTLKKQNESYKQLNDILETKNKVLKKSTASYAKKGDSGKYEYAKKRKLIYNKFRIILINYYWGFKIANVKK